jgi:hypothetical protein
MSGAWLDMDETWLNTVFTQGAQAETNEECGMKSDRKSDCCNATTVCWSSFLGGVVYECEHCGKMRKDIPTELREFIKITEEDIPS